MTIPGGKGRSVSVLLLLLIAPNSWAQLPDKLENSVLTVYKQKRQMELHSGGKLVKVYRIGLGLDPVSPKRQQGDRATPEGEYEICGKHPHSSFHQALILNYPNVADARRGLKEGMISKKEHAAISSAIKAKRCPNFFTRLGGQIEIHGMGSGTDWTWGCVALDNPDIEELYRALPNGTRVVIKP